MRDLGVSRVFESLPALSLARSRIPAFGSVINWSGDSTHAAYVAASTGFALALLGMFAGVLEWMGRLWTEPAYLAFIDGTRSHFLPLRLLPQQAFPSIS